jgi:hypothetical protein
MKNKALFFFFLSCIYAQTFAQTWVDSMDLYSREVLMPPSKYAWTWQSAALLRTMIAQYEQAPNEKKAAYLDYVKKSMHHVRLMVKRSQSK